MLALWPGFAIAKMFCCREGVTYAACAAFSGLRLLLSLFSRAINGRHLRHEPDGWVTLRDRMHVDAGFWEQKLLAIWPEFEIAGGFSMYELGHASCAVSSLLRKNMAVRASCDNVHDWACEYFFLFSPMRSSDYIPLSELDARFSVLDRISTRDFKKM